MSDEKKRKLSVQNRGTMQWTDEEILLLISAVEQRRNLWDHDAAEFRLPKTELWQEVAKIIERATPDDCKSKWLKLRSCFKKICLAKKRAWQSGTRATFNNWRFLTPMAFLEANDFRQSPPSVPSFSMASAGDPFDILGEIGEIGEQKLLTSNIAQCRKRSAPNEPASVSSNSSMSTVLDLAAKAPTAPLQMLDQCSAFGAYIGAELRNMEPNRAAYIRLHMGERFFRLLMETEASTPPCSGN